MRKFEAWQKPADRAAYERRLRQEWLELTPERFGELLQRRKYPTNRIRFAAAGEALATPADVSRVASIVQTYDAISFWIPTRAWRSPSLRPQIEERLLPLKNARVMASLDPLSTRTEVDGLKSNGWPTLFFGIDGGNDGRALSFDWLLRDRFKCPKSWKHRRGFCRECSQGCFREGLVDVHLKKH
jgi:hypothetical protein